MASRVMSPDTYKLVATVLIALTVVTTAVSFLPLPGVGHIIAGLFIGTIKAGLVVLFFMHAIHSDHITWLAILFAVLGLGTLFALALSDYFTRGMLPFVPGH